MNTSLVSFEFRKYMACLGVFHLDLSFLFVQTNSTCNVHGPKSWTSFFCLSIALQLGVVWWGTVSQKCRFYFFYLFWSLLKFQRKQNPSEVKWILKLCFPAGVSSRYLISAVVTLLLSYSHLCSENFRFSVYRFKMVYWMCIHVLTDN